MFDTLDRVSGLLVGGYRIYEQEVVLNVYDLKDRQCFV